MKAGRAAAPATLPASGHRLKLTAEESRREVRRPENDSDAASDPQPSSGAFEPDSSGALERSSANAAAKYRRLESGPYLRLQRVVSAPSAVRF